MKKLLLPLVLCLGCGVGEGEVFEGDDESVVAESDPYEDLTAQTEDELQRSCGAMLSGDRLTRGQTAWSCDKAYRLVMQGDGNLVLYASNPTRALWSTRSTTGAFAQMQSDGNFVLYTAQNRPLWASNTAGRGGAWLSIQTDGNLVVRNSAGHYWDSHTRQCGALLAGGRLGIGQSVTSCNGKYRAVMQHDANFVLYTTTAPVKAVWSTRTNRTVTGAHTIHTVMQTDGNLVVYFDGRALWNSQTAGRSGAALSVRDDGVLSVGRSGAEYWSSGAASGGGGGGSVSVPASLVSRLSVTPYVEQNCSSTSYPGWPHAAKRCTYSSGGITTSVTVANPSPQRVAEWIVDASNQVPSLAALRTSSPAYWEQGLGVFASNVINQSSRIFPLEGGIIENMGSGYVNYQFLKGVTRSCSGCYCRINSLTRSDYCLYQSARGAESYSACQNRVGGSGYTNGWGTQCMQNHADSFNRSFNDHFRAQAFKVAQYMRNNNRCATSGSCSPSQVVQAIREGL